ncbi:MAG: SDR family oxidoreductase [Desulfobacterales bacterium]|nr:MAG: SDR family oxidoreductase [Desulfobacterales bacterium]
MANSIFDLTGKAVLVTGGNGGIGLGMAEELAKSGADICIWGQNEEKNKAAAEKLKSYGRQVIAFKCNVSDEKQVEHNFARTVETLGKVDACFANAGVGRVGTAFHKMDISEWRRIFGVNMEGVFFCFRAAVRHMMDRGDGGSLVVTSSLSAKYGMPAGEHYAATKAGVIALVKGLAVEYARYKIRANAILPGWIETDMTASLFRREKFEKNVMPRIPHRRWGTPADFGPIAVYFASDASAYHTGDAVLIDGGYSCF